MLLVPSPSTAKEATQLAKSVASEASKLSVYLLKKAAAKTSPAPVVSLTSTRGEGTSHGSDHPDCLTTFWAASGPGVTAGEELKASVHIADTAPVVARFLGLDAPAGWDAHVPEGVFVD